MWGKDEKWVDVIYQRNFDTLLFDRGADFL